VQTSSTPVAYDLARGRAEPASRRTGWTAAVDERTAIHEVEDRSPSGAARDFVATTVAGLHFSSVNPGLVLGPALDRDSGRRRTSSGCS